MSSVALLTAVREQQRPLRTAELPDRTRTDQWRDQDTQPRTAAEAPPVDTLVAHWLSAFAAAESALRANAGHLGHADVGTRIHRLREQREQVAASLETLVHGHQAASLLLHCLTRPTIDIRLLGLPSGVTACIFDVEGALTTSAAIHRDAWCTTLDSFLLARAERLRRPFVPVDPNHDYTNHLAGRPRLVGVRTFLASRGISLPDGEPSDLPGTESVQGLANQKQEVLHRLLEQKGVDAYAGSRAYLQLAHVVGARRAVISASANTHLVLEHAGIADLIEQQVDGRTLAADALEPKPAPDTILAACARLAVEPAHAAAFETTAAGIAAARSADVRTVIAVARDDNTTALSASDADHVITDLCDMLERAQHSWQGG